MHIPLRESIIFICFVAQKFLGAFGKAEKGEEPSGRIISLSYE